MRRLDEETIARLAASRCWKGIGVWGTTTPRCQELDRVIHCHNCEVFAAAGRGLLEREVPDEYRREWTDVLTQAKAREAERAMSVLVFRLGDEWFALPTDAFREVAEVREVRTLPHRTSGILRGLVNVRGELLLCVWLEGLLGLSRTGIPGAEGGDRSRPRMVVVDCNGEQWVFAVDEVDGIRFFGGDDLHELPVTVSKDKAAFTRGLFRLEERDVGLVDLDMVLNALRRRILKE